MTTYTSPIAAFDSSLPDGALGPEVATNHDRPPLGSFCFGPAFDGTCFIGLGNKLYYCLPKQPEHWPALYYVEVGTPQYPLKTGLIHNGQVYAMSAIEIFYMQGTGNGTFLPLPMRARTGAQSIKGAWSVDSKGIFHTGADGIYLFSGGSDRKITEQNFEPIFRGETKGDLPGVASMSTSWLHVHKNNLYFGYASSGYSYPNNVLVMNLDTNRVQYYTYNDGSAIEIRAVANDNTNGRLLIGDGTGFVRVIESASYTQDQSTDIEFSIQSKDFTRQTFKHFPKWVKYDVDASLATSCVGSLVLDDAVHQTHTITGVRQTKRRLVGTGNGNRASIRISGSGPVSIYLAEAE